MGRKKRKVMKRFRYSEKLHGRYREGLFECMDCLQFTFTVMMQSDNDTVVGQCSKCGLSFKTKKQKYVLHLTRTDGSDFEKHLNSKTHRPIDYYGIFVDFYHSPTFKARRVIKHVLRKQ